MSEQKNNVQAPCSECLRSTTHEVLFEKGTYAMIECRGCGSISMAHEMHWDGRIDRYFYPSPVSRKWPKWAAWLAAGVSTPDSEKQIGALLWEVYAAVDGGQHRLAAMGIRALLEQVMILKVGDLQTFNQKLDAFQAKGYISSRQRDAMRATLDVGDAAMHRAHRPSEPDLKLALDIVEGVLAPIFAYKELAEKLAENVPPRSPRGG